jgi:MATE family multidrug resistance protein
MHLPLRTHLAEMGRLATPVVLSRTGIMAMALVNLAFLGRAGIDEVAYMAAASVPVGVVLVACNGMMSGTLVGAAHALGRGEAQEAGQVWRRSLPFAFLVGAIGAGICLFGELVLRATGQAAAIAAGAAPVLHILGLSLPANALFFASAFFLEAIKRPMPAVAAIQLANLVNAGLNWMLVFGHLGAPALGAAGSAIATTAARCIMALALIAYVVLMPDHRRYAVRRRPEAWWRDGRMQRSVGYAAGTSSGLESAAFGAMTLFAGWFGATTLAAYAIALNAWTLMFMAGIGLGIGTAVRVGHATGAGDRRAMREAGWVGLGVVVAFMAIVALCFVVFKRPLVALFTADPTLVREAAAMLAMCAWVMTIDSAKSVMLQAVRGTGDTWIPTMAQFLLVFGVMVPSAYVLAFTLGLGPAGLFLGMLAAAIASLAFLAWRFWRRCG